MLLLKAGLNYLYLSYCPWVVENSQKTYLLEQFINFTRTCVDTFFVYVTFIMTIGFAVIKSDLNEVEMKFALAMPASKFMLQQVLSTMASF